MQPQRYRLLALTLITTLLTACQPLASEPTITPAQSPTAAPPPTLAPTATPAHLSFPHPWPLPAFTPAQVADVRACDVGTLRDTRYPERIAAAQLTETLPLETPCDWAVLASALAQRAARGTTPGRDALLTALADNPAFALRDEIFYDYFGELALVKAPPQAALAVASVHIAYSWGGLGDQLDPYTTEITDADGTPQVTGTSPAQPKPAELSRLTQALGAALTDFVPIAAPVTWQPCTDNYPDWDIVLTFTDGTTLTLNSYKSNALTMGGPWQTTLDDQLYLQSSPAFADALGDLVTALDLPLGRPAATTCFPDPLFDKAYPESGAFDVTPAPTSTRSDVIVVSTATAAPIGTPSTSGTLKIVSSLPMTGSSAGQTNAIVNAIKMKLAEVNYRACDGMIPLEYEALDDASAYAGRWTAEAERENALYAVADPNVMVYIGTYNSGAAKVSIPILNEAHMVMISPGNTYPGLTKPDTGEADEPDKYYPTGVRNYTRVTTADDVQGAVAAHWAKSLGAHSVYVLDDYELYGMATAGAFEQTAEEIGLTVLNHAHMDTKAPDYTVLARVIAETHPDLIYFGGITQNNAGPMLHDLRAEMPDVLFMGPDGIKEDGFIEASGADAAEGVYATVTGVAFDQLPARGQAWYQAYKDLYNTEPQEYAVYGYEAAQVALAAIEQTCILDREEIRAAVFATHDFDGVLGTWSFDANGDTTLSATTGYQVKDGAWVAVETLSLP